MKPVQTLKVSISGVRGVVGDSLTPSLLVRFSESFGTLMNAGTIVIGRDTRTSGEMVKHAVLSGLLSTGCRVVDLDIAPVPTIQFMVRRLRARGGIAITASHNPAQWNALKFIREDGCFLNTWQARELLDIYHQGDFRKVPGNEMIDPRKVRNGPLLHGDAIIEKLGKLPARGRKPVVVVDCVNGAGSVMSKDFLARLGCKVTAIHNEPNGLFPRPPEPLPQNLTALCEAVKRFKADIGFAQDADADRLAVVSEKGLPIGEDYTLALAADHVLSFKKGTVVVNLSTSRVLDDIAERHGCRMVRSKIGEINVTETMKAENAVVGGEGNGGVIYPEVNLARDSFTGMALILHRLTAGKAPVSKIAGSFPQYIMKKTSVPCPRGLAVELLEKLSEKFSGKNVDRTDGLKISRGQSWVLIRPSNTEPILRLVIEAPDEHYATRLEKEFSALISETISRLSS